MMDFRVIAALMDSGREVIKRTFSSRKEAEAFVEGLTQEGSVLDGLKLKEGALTVELQELCNGTWTSVNMDLVRL